MGDVRRSARASSEESAPSSCPVWSTGASEIMVQRYRVTSLFRKHLALGPLVGWLVGWFVCWLVGWLVGLGCESGRGRSARASSDESAPSSCPVCDTTRIWVERVWHAFSFFFCLVGWRVGRLVGWLVGWSVVCLFVCFCFVLFVWLVGVVSRGAGGTRERGRTKVY